MPHNQEGPAAVLRGPSRIVVLPSERREDKQPHRLRQEHSRCPHNDEAAAVWCANRARLHGGRKGLMLLQIAGHYAGKALGFEPNDHTLDEDRVAFDAERGVA